MALPVTSPPYEKEVISGEEEEVSSSRSVSHTMPAVAIASRSVEESVSTKSNHLDHRSRSKEHGNSRPLAQVLLTS